VTPNRNDSEPGTHAGPHRRLRQMPFVPPKRTLP
jgi:hypothetical protein